MIDRPLLEFQEKIDTVLVDRRCCSITTKLGIMVYRGQHDLGFFAFKSGWNFNCGFILDHITYGAICDCGLHLVQLILHRTLGKKHQYT